MYFKRLNKEKKWTRTSEIFWQNFKKDSFSKEAAYVLGFLWADGHVVNPSFKQYISRITILFDDFLNVEKSFDTLGHWLKYKLKRKGDKKFFGEFCLCNKKFHAFLVENDYHLKSTVSPTKILSLIPDNLHYLFFRGVFDGDGHNGVVEKSCFNVGISASFNFDWSSFEHLCQVLKINHKIEKIKKTFENGKVHQSSLFFINTEYDCKLFLDYIYKGRENDCIGLDRKFLVYETYKKNHLQTTTPRRLDENGKIIKFEDVTGQRFGKLIALDRVVINKTSFWNCQCECGNKIQLKYKSLRRGTSSCGCFGLSRQTREINTKRILLASAGKLHGDSATKFNVAWQRMNKTVKILNLEYDWRLYLDFKRDKFDEYQKVLNENPDKIISLRRKDTSKGFTKDNTFWTTKNRNMNKTVKYINNHD